MPDLYEGDWAVKFVDIVQKQGGLMTRKDLASYQPTWTVDLSKNWLDERVSQEVVNTLKEWGLLFS